jgi:hypothetical protein
MSIAGTVFTVTICVYRTYTDMMISEAKKKLLIMKTLAFVRDEKKDRVTVACADGMVSVSSTCAYCRHCTGIVVGKRVAPAPQKEALDAIHLGRGSDESLMTAAMMFNTLVRDGSAIACDDDANAGFLKLY